MDTVRIESVEDLPLPPPDEKPRRKFRLIRMPDDAMPEQCLDVLLAGIDDDVATPDDDERPAWEPADADAVDKLVAAQVMTANHWELIERMARDRRRAAQSRIDKIINAYQRLLKCAMPAPGKTRGKWIGPYSGGSYNGQERLPELKVIDKDAAIAAGVTREKVTIELDTAKCREALKAGPVAGIKVIEQLPVSYTAPKIKGEGE